MKMERANDGALKAQTIDRLPTQSNTEVFLRVKALKRKPQLLLRKSRKACDSSTLYPQNHTEYKKIDKKHQIILP